MEMCHPSRSFQGDATVPAGYAMMTMTMSAYLDVGREAGAQLLEAVMNP